MAAFLPLFYHKGSLSTIQNHPSVDQVGDEQGDARDVGHQQQHDEGRGDKGEQRLNDPLRAHL